MSTLLLTHPGFTNHDTGPGHPERPDRMRAIDKALTAPEFSALVREAAPLHDGFDAAVTRVHPQAYVAALAEVRPAEGEDPRYLDGDTLMSAGTWQAACRSVGAGLRAVDAVMNREDGIVNAFCQVRPPGHHAETARPMGFCLFNAVAVAGYYARDKHGAQRVAVLDFDVHHGNGTQAIFWDDKDMFFGSTHQMPLFPGTGARGETGAGNIWNAPLRSGDGGVVFREAFETRIFNALADFQPDLIIISAGFDAHEADPLGGLRLQEADFEWATAKIMDYAARLCDGRVVSMLEGGYDLDALASSVSVHVKTLMR